MVFVGDTGTEATGAWAEIGDGLGIDAGDGMGAAVGTDATGGAGNAGWTATG